TSSSNATGGGVNNTTVSNAVFVSGGATVTTGVVGTNPVNGGGTALNPTALVAGQVFNSTLNVNDNFTGLSATLSGTTVNGNAGDTDVITLSDALTVNIGNAGTGGTITNIKTLNLANGANNFGFGAATTGITTVNGGTGDDTVDLTGAGTSFAAGNVNLGSGSNTLTLGALNYTGTFSAGSGGDTLKVVNSTNISGANVTGFEVLDVAAGGASVTMTAAQYNSGAGITTATGNDTITLTTAGSIIASTLIENYVLANGTNAVTFNSGAATQTFTGGTGNDTFTTTLSGLANKTINAGLGADTVTVTNAVNIAFTLATAGAAGAALSGVDTVNFNAVNNNTVTMFSGAATVNTAGGTFILGSGGQTLTATGAVTVTGGAGADTITFSSGADTIIASGSTIAAIDTVNNFKLAGADVFKTGTAATSLNYLYIATSDAAGLAAALSTAAAIAGTALTANTQAYLVTVGSGVAAGTYVFQNIGSNVGAVDATDFVVKLTGATGTILASDFIV
ncbi:beta strand repeat-containing protein, partial [Undibacterium sp. TC9W]|uniref:beta strand repeat-containing protein n=1 Tax=Undibacterium sp. TC9W TaxID=3413053 RepID=UPI003BF42C71